MCSSIVIRTQSYRQTHHNNRYPTFASQAIFIATLQGNPDRANKGIAGSVNATQAHNGGSTKHYDDDSGPSTLRSGSFYFQTLWHFFLHAAVANPIVV